MLAIDLCTIYHLLSTENTSKIEYDFFDHKNRKSKYAVNAKTLFSRRITKHFNNVFSYSCLTCNCVKRKSWGWGDFRIIG